jgi:hypothetical protein
MRRPPTTWGRNEAPNVIAPSSADPVAVKTSTDRATVRRVSAPIARALVRNTVR